MSHSQRCLDSNRFGDGFDCLCDEEPIAVANRKIEKLRTLLGDILFDLETDPHAEDYYADRIKQIREVLKK